MRIRTAPIWLLAVVGLGSCNTRPVAPPDQQQDGGCAGQCGDPYLDVSVTNKVDVLFVIDNSNSTEPIQASLNQYFPNFVQPLEDLPTKPDMHIGVVTSDLGAGQFTPPSCDTIGGDQGLLQNTAKGNTCTSSHLINTADRFLTYGPDSSGGAAVNVTGDIADAFACYAAVGGGGCGFEHPLASMRAALDGCETDVGCTQRQNTGFFRRDAYLAVVVLTDEDDCSAPSSSTLFDPSKTALDSALGPLTSYRCFEFGNLCDGVDPGRGEGLRQSCVPGNKDPSPGHQLTPTRDFVEFLKALKPQDPRMVYVSVIAGPPTPVVVGMDANGYPQMQPSCVGGLGSADPAIRLADFVGQFDQDRGSFISMCQMDLSPAMAQIAAALARVLGHQCLGAPLVNKTPGAALTPDCVVQDRVTVDSAAGSYSYVTVPACDEVVCDPGGAPGGDCRCQTHAGASLASPCWYVWPDPTTCPLVNASLPTEEQNSVGSGYQFQIDRGTDAECHVPPPPAGTYPRVQCASCMANPAANSFDCSRGCAEHWPECCPADGSEPAYGCYGG